MGRESRDQPPATADIRLLISEVKALRREVQSLRVRCWQSEDRATDLESALRAAEAERQQALHSLREREAELAALQRLSSGGAFFERGFRLGDGVAVAGRAARRPRHMPSGTMVFGPYVRLRPGRYAATIAARLYEPLPFCAQFTADVVCAGGQHLIAARRFRVLSSIPARSREFAFTVPEGLDHSDFEVRIWARRGAPLEVSQIELRQLSTAGPAPSAAAQTVPAGAPA
jgi:hypothetical protein